MPLQHYDFLVARTQERVRLDIFLATLLATIVPKEARLSRTAIVRLIEEGAVSVDDTPSRERAQQLHCGQKVRISIKTETERNADSITRRATECSHASKRKKPPLDILFEDDYLICLVKPAGLISHPAPSTKEETLVERLIDHCAPNLAGYPSDHRCGIVHRLDKNTSGVMLAAKTEEARLKLCGMFANHNLQRRYLALAWGIPSPAQGCISAPITRHPKLRTKMHIAHEKGTSGINNNKGRRAVTHYKTLSSFQLDSFDTTASLISCELETGRTHQIRVHLASIGHPIIGDTVYARNKPSPQQRKLLASLNIGLESPRQEPLRQALHAYHLSFTHPITAKPLSFSAPPPSDFQTLQAGLKKLAKTESLKQNL